MSIEQLKNCLKECALPINFAEEKPVGAATNGLSESQ